MKRNTKEELGGTKKGVVEAKERLLHLFLRSNSRLAAAKKLQRELHLRSRKKTEERKGLVTSFSFVPPLRTYQPVRQPVNSSFSTIHLRFFFKNKKTALLKS